MRVLHYTLGFAPYRSGGLIRYANDLMVAQVAMGDDVFALYPGCPRPFVGKCSVGYECRRDGVTVYEMVNPLPVPLLYGVGDADAMMNEDGLDLCSFGRLLDIALPDVLHLHTLMGMPRAYLRMSKARGIRIVFTTHDYFGLCPRVNFVNAEGQVCGEGCGEKCGLCNKNAPGKSFLQIRSIKFPEALKNFLRKML